MLPCRCVHCGDRGSLTQLVSRHKRVSQYHSGLAGNTAV